MKPNRWPDPAFFRQAFRLYLKVWVGAAALAIWAISLWFAPFTTMLASYACAVTLESALLKTKAVPAFSMERPPLWKAVLLTVLGVFGMDGSALSPSAAKNKRTERI